MKENNITIFLDRDGVINKDRGVWIRKWSQFVFIPHIFKVLRAFKQRGYRVIVVTNQGGVGEGVMFKNDVIAIHKRMQKRIYEEGGQIDWVYFCPHIKEDECYCRKPQPGMFIQAKKNFPEIDFENSFMIGDRWVDMDAASVLGIKTCMLIDKLTDLHKCRVEPDFCISDISQAIQLVPQYFENKELHQSEINWVGGENDKSYGKYVKEDGTIENYGIR